MARIRQTVNVLKMKKPPAELANWSRKDRLYYWKGVFEKRRDERLQKKVFGGQKILYGIFIEGKIVENQRFISFLAHQKSHIIFLHEGTRKRILFLDFLTFFT